MLKGVFWLRIITVTQIFRSRFKQSKICLLIPHIYVLGYYCFGDFWEYLVKLVKFTEIEIENFEDLMLF